MAKSVPDTPPTELDLHVTRVFEDELRKIDKFEEAKEERINRERVLADLDSILQEWYRSECLKLVKSLLFFPRAFFFYLFSTVQFLLIKAQTHTRICIIPFGAKSLFPRTLCWRQTIGLKRRGSERNFCQNLHVWLVSP